jgi:tRNA(Ile)-lysidine synthase
MVVAVSGGPDSVALVRGLLAVPALAGQRLVLAHLNHLLRGRDSDADEAFVHGFLETLRSQGHDRLTLHTGRSDVAAQARAERGNLESVARRVRYAWLAEVARREGVPWVATGHTADDQAETVLHRLLRGTGPKGLRGIAARRALVPGVELVRPLLRVTRAEVLAYLASLGQTFREDASNEDRRYMRNRIRHELLPYLAEHYNPAIVAVLCRLAEGACELYQGYEADAAALLAAAEKPRAGDGVVLDRGCLARSPRHLVREVFRLIWAREGWPQGRMSFAAWDRLADVSSGTVRAVDLPGGVRARCRERVVLVGRDL